jgi:RHS repeat-associated protein
MGCPKLTYHDNLPTLKVAYSSVLEGSEPCTSLFSFNRKSSAGVYRYGFNGMEKDDEISGNGNSLTTPFRMYNPRLGRWMSTDPITHAMYSPYSAFDNNPIYYSDPSEANSEKTVHTPPKYGTWDNGPIIETGYTTYGGYNASLGAGMSFDGRSTLSGIQYVNNSVFSTVQSGARTLTSAYTFAEFLNYNKEWSTTYSENNNAMFKPLYNSWSYGASIGVSVHPLGNYTYGNSYTSAIKQMNGAMTQQDSINKMTENMTQGNASNMLKDMEKTIGRKRTYSIVNSFFGI